METLVHADIFFIVTTVFVAILCVGSAVALYYIVGILRDLKQLTAIIREEGQRINGDLAQLHQTVREEGSKLKAIFDFLLAFGQHRRSRKDTRTSH